MSGTVVSISSVNYHLYEDDTPLFLSFSAADFAYNISLLEQTIMYTTGCHLTFFLSIPLRLSSCWLSATLTLKLGALIIHRANSVILSSVHSARNLGAIYDRNFPNFSFFQLAVILFVISEVFDILLIIPQPVLAVRLYYCNFIHSF
jgi:hypothetical protein